MSQAEPLPFFHGVFEAPRLRPSKQITICAIPVRRRPGGFVFKFRTGAAQVLHSRIFRPQLDAWAESWVSLAYHQQLGESGYASALRVFNISSPGCVYEFWFAFQRAFQPIGLFPASSNLILFSGGLEGNPPCFNTKKPWEVQFQDGVSLGISPAFAGVRRHR